MMSTAAAEDGDSPPRRKIRMEGDDEDADDCNEENPFLLPPAASAVPVNAEATAASAMLLSDRAHLHVMEPADLPPPPQQQPAADPVAVNTLGFLLSYFAFDWTSHIANRVRALERVTPGVWLAIRDAVESVVVQLESGAVPATAAAAAAAAAAATVCAPAAPAAAAAAAAVAEEDSADEDDDVEGEAADTETGALRNVGFAIGAEPVLHHWSYQWFLVQRVGSTAALTNELTQRMDPTAFYKKKKATRAEELSADEEDSLNAAVRTASFTSADGEDYIICALHIQLKEWTAALANLLELWSGHHNGTVVLKFRSATAFIDSVKKYGSSIRRVDCRHFSNVAIHVDDMNAEFCTALAACTTSLAPTESVQFHVKEWKLRDAGTVSLFNSEPRQVTIAAPFKKRLAVFLSTLPAGCREVVLPLFGSRMPPPDAFAQLLSRKSTADDRFQRVVLGDCKLGDGGLLVSPPDALLAFERITSGTITVENRFPARKPEPIALMHQRSPPVSSSNSSRPTLQCTTTVVKNCMCAERGGITQTRIYLNRTTVPSPIATAIVANGCLFTPVRCIPCGVEAFVKRELPSDPFDECYHSVVTLFVECIPTGAMHAFVTGGAFPNVRHLYLGETVNAEVDGIIEFICTFPRLNNVITFVPRYMSRQARTSFLKSIAARCDDLQRVCLTRRKDKRDAQGFAYNLVPPPNAKDFVITKTHHPQQSVVLASPADAAAFARCTLYVSVPPHATEGLYLFRNV